MAESTFLTLITLGLCVGAPLFAAVILGGLALLIGMLVRQGRALARPEALEREAGRLRPWGPAGFAALGAEWRGTYARWPGRFLAAGYGPLAADTEQAGFLFSYRSGGGEHGLEARTLSQTVRLEFSAEAAQVSVDGRPLGALHLATGAITGADGRPLGDSRRAAGLELFINGVAVGRQHRRYPLTLQGRTVAHLVTVAGRGWARTAVPLVVEVRPDLSPAEADWLLALAVLEVGYYGSQRARSSRLV